MLKIDLKSGEPLWLKRLGSRNQDEEVRGLAVRAGANTVVLSGSFSLPAGSTARVPQV